MQKGKTKEDIWTEKAMDYIQKERAEKIASQVKAGVYPEFMIWEVILANGAISLSEAKKIQKEVQRLLAENR